MVIFNNTVLSPSSNSNTITIKAPYPKTPYEIENFFGGDISNSSFAWRNVSKKKQEKPKNANSGAWTLPITNKI